MNPFQLDPASSSAVTAASAGLFSWLATYLLHSTLLLGLAWAISARLRGRHPLAEQAIWRTALFGSILTATLQLVTGWQPLGGAFAVFSGTAGPATEPAANVELVAASTPVGATEATPDIGRSTLPAAIAFVPPSSQVSSAVTTASTRSAKPPVWPWIALFWGAGAAALLLRWGAAHAALSRRLRPRLEVVDGTLFRTLRRLRGEAGFDPNVRLTCAHRLSVPIALGHTRPEICVPPRALSHLDEREAESLLAHELAHLARRDPAALNLTQIAASLFFIQPLVWVARRKLYDLSELLADDWAIGRTGRPLSLARCLAEVACWSMPERRLPVPSMAEASSPLGHRIRRLLGEIRPSRRLPAWALPACGVVLVAFAAVAPAISARSRQEPDAAVSAPEATEADSAEAGRADRESYRSSQPADTYVHETPSADEIPPLTEDEERELGEHAEDLAADFARMGKEWDSEKFEAEMEKLTESFKGFELPEADRAKLEGEIDALVARTVPDPQSLARLTAATSRLADPGLSREERERISAEVGRLVAGIRPSEEEIRKLTERARELAPRAEEIRRMAEDAKRYAEAHRPSDEELRTIKERSREYEREARRIVEEHRGEIEKAQREMRQQLEEMRERLREDIERSLEGEEQGLRDQAHRPRTPRTPRPPRSPRPALAPTPEPPALPGSPAPSPRAALAPMAPMPPMAPRALPTPAPGTPALPARPALAPGAPAPMVAPTPGTPAPLPRPARAPRALPTPVPDPPAVADLPEPEEAPEAPEAPPVHVR